MGTPWHEARFGNGPVELVWLHGWGQTHASLMPLAQGFDARALNRLVDLPGFGATAPLAEGAGTADYADALMAQLGPHAMPRVLIGHSYGARVAVQAAARHGNAVDAIVLVAGAGIPRKRSLAWKLRAWTLKRLGRIARLAGPAAQDAYRRRFGSADYVRAGRLRGTLVSAVTENLTAQAAAIACPVLLLYGEEDSETPVDIGQAYAAACADARLKVLPGFGHLDILSRGAHLCQRHIARFLDESGL